MRMDKGIKFLEMKISDMEKMIEIKKEAIANIRKIQEMIKQGKCQIEKRYQNLGAEEII